ncbi:tyrosine-type recombinase/integrase [Phaeobacter sp. B1627]|uniref:tyrosine-type recombinase/integrase n=1 Tax=Phaeobacter sp. B1627 TaxID=2583809 RepID=UPI002106BC51|nr:tyrosine-type recombinase/integrase [Phaeobacter sp. B1627]
MRASEVVRLKVGDIDGEQNIIRIVQAKGRKDRNVMLPTNILGLLREWWKERPVSQDAGVAGPERVIFPGYCGRHLSPRQISRLFKQAARAAGIIKPVTLHTLRHSFATHLLERGVDIRVIQALLGHTKLTTTARHASVATGMISAVVSPLDDLTAAKRRKGRSILSHAVPVVPDPRRSVGDSLLFDSNFRGKFFATAINGQHSRHRGFKRLCGVAGTGS